LQVDVDGPACADLDRLCHNFLQLWVRKKHVECLQGAAALEQVSSMGVGARMPSLYVA
jgi:hypothetical protein